MLRNKKKTGGKTRAAIAAVKIAKMNTEGTHSCISSSLQKSGSRKLVGTTWDKRQVDAVTEYIDV